MVSKKKMEKNPNELTSYIPISLLPIISKIFEKLLLSKLKLFLIRENVIPDHQFKFREHHSISEQVHRVANFVRTSLENKN